MVDAGQLYLCIDAGGTKTAAAICNGSGTVLSRGIAGSANMSEIGPVRSSNHIVDAALMAINKCVPSGLSAQTRLAKVWIGVAGCDTIKDSERMTAELKDIFFSNCSISVTNDGLLLSAPIIAHGSSWGVAVVAGTGSVVLGIKISPEGEASQICRRGGQGHLFGDHGSAFQLGITATKFAADDWDFGLEKADGLADKVREHWGIASTGDAPSKAAELDLNVDPITASNHRKLKIADLAPVVTSCASTIPPCPLASRVLDFCASTLANDIAAVVHQARHRGHGDTGHATLSVTGGAISQAIYRDTILDKLKVHGIEFGHVEVVADAAAAGAMALARVASKITSSEENGL